MQAVSGGKLERDHAVELAAETNGESRLDATGDVGQHSPPRQGMSLAAMLPGEFSKDEFF
jgi:hypothetical protein